MNRRFTQAQPISEDTHTLRGYSPLITTLLYNRGITTPEEAERFLKPNYDRDMHDPFLMPDMERAVDRVHAALEQKEKIVVYADYDCDGIPGAVIMHDFFTKIGYTDFQIYIPDRHLEGYGLNTEALDQFSASGATLVITIDLGTSDHENIVYANQKGIDVIVTDHHLPHDTLPEAYAVLNPKIGNMYPEPMLCGSGVIFKFVQGFLKKYGTEYLITDGWEKWMLDMAGLATLSDMVPLRGENRTIASFGMQVLRKSPRPGLQQLLRALKIDQRYLLEDDLTFMVTPRINAASRMDSPMRAFEMLAERDTLKAGQMAAHLTKINDERKYVVAQIMKEVKASLSNRTITDVIVIGNPKWRIGVLGLVASKIVEEYDRPTFVWGREGSESLTTVKGSVRSNGSVNVVALMEKAKESFVDYGGHELAGGFSALTEHIHTLEETLCSLYGECSGENVIPHASIDAVLSISDVNEKTCRELAELAPFGLGNPKPTFLFPDLTIKSVRMFGKEKNHLELTVCDDAFGECVAMSFFADVDTFTKKVVAGERVDIIGTIDKSYFMGRPQLRVRILDIR